MKVLRRNEDSIVLGLRAWEASLLRSVLERYPVVPPAHHRIRAQPEGRADEERQRLLDEALAEHRQERRREVWGLLHDPARMAPAPSGIRFTLRLAEVEWLLQVLNDVRVGSWISLGAPETDLQDFDLNEQTAVQAWMMELAGYFQMQLLAAIEGGGT